MTPANPTGPGSSCVDLYYLSIQCRYPCVIEELQTREVSVNVPESLLKDMVLDTREWQLLGARVVH